MYIHYFSNRLVFLHLAAPEVVVTSYYVTGILQKPLELLRSGNTFAAFKL